MLEWYRAHARDLPWRRSRDPYAIWVSEVMLQQTRVETVVPYYRRFLADFPTVQSLADAPEDAVLAAWSGLGYYRRARLLHRGVKEVVEHYGGQVPEAPEARRALSGVGRYTAGAIGSIAFGRPEAAVDGNVMRVLSRLYRVEDPVPSARSERAIWALADELVQGDAPGELNQSLMELGARICTPRTPQCAHCPLSLQCAARAAGVEAQLPHKRPKKSPRPERWVAVIASRSDGRLALVKGDGSRFGGLYGVPATLGQGEQGARQALRQARVVARLGAPIGHVEHVLTHRVMTIECWTATGAHRRRADGPVLRFVSPEHLNDVGLSTMMRKVIALSPRP